MKRISISARLILLLSAASLGVAGCQTTGSVSVGYYDSLLWNDYYYGHPRPPRPDPPDRPDRPVKPTHPIAKPPVARPPIHRPPVARPMPARGGRR